MSELTLDEAIKVLRQHNEKGTSVLRITRGETLEKDLLAQVLDSCEQLLSEKAEYKRLLKAAVDDLNFSSICLDCDACKVCAKRYNISCEKKFKWRCTDEVKKLIKS